MADTRIIFDLIARDHATKTFKKANVAAAAFGAGIATLAVRIGKDSVAAYTDAEQAQTRLAAAFQKFPGLADTNIDRLRELNTALAAKTKFDDDATASGQAVLAQFNLTGKQIESITPLLQDYAAKTGQDLPTAASNLGKALLGNTRALKTIGVNYKATGDAGKDFTAIQQALNDKVGGFATKQGKTAAGQAEILRNQFGEVEETVGSKLVPALTDLAKGLLDVIGFVQRNQTTVKSLAVTFGTLAATVWTVNKAAAAYTAVMGAATAAQGLATTTAATWIGVKYLETSAWLKSAAAVTVATARLYLYEAAAGAAAAAQWALNAAMAANPVGLVVAAIALLVVGMVIAYKKSETFRDIVNGAFHAVTAAGQAMWNALKVAFGFIVDKFLWVAGMIVKSAAAAFGWVPGIGPKLKKAAKEFESFRDSVNASLSGIQRTIPISFVAIGTSAPNSRYAGKQLPVDGKVTTSSDSYHLKRMADAVAGPTDSVKRLRQHSYQQFGVT